MQQTDITTIPKGANEIDLVIERFFTYYSTASRWKALVRNLYP